MSSCTDSASQIIDNSKIRWSTFEKLDHNLLCSIFAIIGGNGAGKSSILRSVVTCLNEAHTHSHDTAVELSVSEPQLLNNPTYSLNYNFNARRFLWTENFFSEPIKYLGTGPGDVLPNPFLQTNTPYLSKQLKEVVLILCPPDGDEDNNLKSLEELPPPWLSLQHPLPLQESGPWLPNFHGHPQPHRCRPIQNWGTIHSRTRPRKGSRWIPQTG